MQNWKALTPIDPVRDDSFISFQQLYVIRWEARVEIICQLVWRLLCCSRKRHVLWQIQALASRSGTTRSCDRLERSSLPNVYRLWRWRWWVVRSDHLLHQRLSCWSTSGCNIPGMKWKEASPGCRKHAAHHTSCYLIFSILASVSFASSWVSRCGGSCVELTEIRENRTLRFPFFSSRMGRTWFTVGLADTSSTVHSVHVAKRRSRLKSHEALGSRQSHERSYLSSAVRWHW